MRKKPYKGDELFDEICKRIELPDILDYYNGWCYSDDEIKDYYWDFGNHLEFGSNEGIYLTMYARSKDKEICLGTFKTLRETKEAMYTMSRLLADFIMQGRLFVSENFDDFTWEGYKVSAEGCCFSYDCSTLEKARERRKQLLEEYDKVTIFDYTKRKEVE